MQANQKSTTLPILWLQQREMLPIKLYNSRTMGLHPDKTMAPTYRVMGAL